MRFPNGPSQVAKEDSLSFRPKGEIFLRSLASARDDAPPPVTFAFLREIIQFLLLRTSRSLRLISPVPSVWLRLGRVGLHDADNQAPESGNPSHGRSVLDCLRSRQEEFSIVSPESSFVPIV